MDFLSVLEIWIFCFSLETWIFFYFSLVIESFSSWETWNLVFSGTFFEVVNDFSTEILNFFFWAN